MRSSSLIVCLLILAGAALLGPFAFCANEPVSAKGTRIIPDPHPTAYPDGRPAARLRLDAEDAGPVLRHGGGPGGCDDLGARDVWVWSAGGKHYMHYDGAGPRGWLACLAVSDDLAHWSKRGPVLDLGAPGPGRRRPEGTGAGKWPGPRRPSRFLGGHRVYLFGHRFNSRS